MKGKVRGGAGNGAWSRDGFAIGMPAKPPASSWWIQAGNRAEWRAALEREQERMRQSTVYTGKKATD